MPRVLRSSRLKTAALLAGSIVAVIVGAAMVRSKEPYGWFVLSFSALGVAVFLSIFLKPNRLEISEDGFTTVTLGRRWSVDWDQCGSFRTSSEGPDTFYQGPGTTRVVFDCDESQRSRLAGLAELLGGTTAALPDTYGMSPAELAELLNRYRAVARSEGPDAREG